MKPNITFRHQDGTWTIQNHILGKIQIADIITLWDAFKSAIGLGWLNQTEKARVIYYAGAEPKDISLVDLQNEFDF